MFRFWNSCLRSQKNFLFSRKCILLLVCVALLMLIWNVNNYSSMYKTAKEYLQNSGNIVSKGFGDDRHFHGYNSKTKLSVGDTEKSRGKYQSFHSALTTSDDELLTRQLPLLHNDSKPLSPEQRTPPISAMRSIESFIRWLNVQPVPSYHAEFLLNHFQLCQSKGSNVSLLMAVFSAVDHEEARSAIRETWGGYARDQGAKLLFFLGIPEKSELIEKVLVENTKFEDIVQSNFLDTYNNLTFKTVSMLKWVSEFCSEVKYVLKVDDDMFINSQRFLDFVGRTNASKTIMGYLFLNGKPIRSKSSKWYVPYSDYPVEKYPDYASETAYLISGDSVRILYDTSSKILYAIPCSLHKCEDVCVTGFAAEMTGIKRIKLDGMFISKQKIQPCSFHRLFSSHQHSPSDIREKWLSLKKSNLTCKY